MLPEVGNVRVGEGEVEGERWDLGEGGGLIKSRVGKAPRISFIYRPLASTQRKKKTSAQSRSGGGGAGAW